MKTIEIIVFFIMMATFLFFFCYVLYKEDFFDRKSLIFVFAIFTFIMLSAMVELKIKNDNNLEKIEEFETETVALIQTFTKDTINQVQKFKDLKNKEIKSLKEEIERLSNELETERSNNCFKICEH